MIGTTLISSGLVTTGSSWSRDSMEETARLIAREEQEVPTDFDGLCRWMGYRPHLLRHAIGRATRRDTVIARLKAAGIKYHNSDEVLADAFLAEIAPVQMLEAAE